MSVSLHSPAGFGRRTAPPEPEALATGGGRLAAVLAIAGGLAIGGTAFALRPSPLPAPRDVEAVVGARVLRVPAAVVRANGHDSRLDIALRWPDFGPALVQGRGDKGTVPRLGDVLLVTLSPAEPGQAGADRLSGLYARFLDASVKAGPGGLIERRFRVGSPYENQELLFSPPDGRRFMAICDARPRAGEVLPPLCTTQFERDGLSVQVRFEPGLVESWDRIEAGLMPLLDRWSRPAG